jgi:hypothetical protein
VNTKTLRLLSDPDTRENLELRPDALVNPRSGRSFPMPYLRSDIESLVSTSSWASGSAGRI